MPRDANGNYTLPAGNPVQTDELIESNWANSTMQDVGAEMTDSLSRSGKGGVTGPFQIIDELTGVPGLAYSNEPTSGLKRQATGDVRMQILGSDRQRWRSDVPEVQVGAVWKPIAWEEPGQKIMRGDAGVTVAWFYNTTVPPGWTIEAPDTNLRNLAVASGGATPVGAGTIAGDIDPSQAEFAVDTVVSVDLPADTGGHSLTVGQNGPHQHSYAGNNVILAAAGGSGAGAPQGDTKVTELSGSGDPHTHPIGGTAAGTGTDTIPFNPRRAIGILGKLDA